MYGEAPTVPSRADTTRPIPNRVPPEEAMRVNRYRRLMVSLGWLAAFLMAAGAGWKTS
jgi:hypothetical protein